MDKSQTPVISGPPARVIETGEAIRLTGASKQFEELREDYGLQPVFTSRDGVEFFDRREILAALSEHSGKLAESPPRSAERAMPETAAVWYVGGAELFGYLRRDYGLEPDGPRGDNEVFSQSQIDAAVNRLIARK